MNCLVAILNACLGVASLICLIAGLSGLSKDGKEVSGAILVLAGIVGGSVTVLNCVLENVIHAIREGRPASRQNDK
jgi:hypothetical protein